jgi:hypothetical protein
LLDNTFLTRMDPFENDELGSVIVSLDEVKNLSDRVFWKKETLEIADRADQTIDDEESSLKFCRKLDLRQSKCIRFFFGKN